MRLGLGELIIAVDELGSQDVRIDLAGDSPRGELSLELLRGQRLEAVGGLGRHEVVERDRPWRRLGAFAAANLPELEVFGRLDASEHDFIGLLSVLIHSLERSRPGRPRAPLRTMPSDMPGLAAVVARPVADCDSRLTAVVDGVCLTSAVRAAYGSSGERWR